MSSLSPRLQLRVQQKQILTPGLVQMVSLLQLNRLELKDMISAEIAQNPVLEEAAEGGEGCGGGREFHPEGARLRGTRKDLEADAGSGRTALHRRDHPRRISQVHRKGCRAGAALPD